MKSTTIDLGPVRITYAMGLLTFESTRPKAIIAAKKAECSLRFLVAAIEHDQANSTDLATGAALRDQAFEETWKEQERRKLDELVSRKYGQETQETPQGLDLPDQ